jgi:hypothetical protein
MLAESDSPAAQAANAPAQPTSRPAQPASRPTRSTPTADDSATTPIFEEMISAWLADPMTSQEEAPVSWNSAADEGWSAARRAAEPPITTRTKSGLPRREPGNQLVPGGAEPGPSVQEEPTQARPEPESIRAGLNSYDRGVRDGRSIRSSNPFAAEDIR